MGAEARAWPAGHKPEALPSAAHVCCPGPGAEWHRPICTQTPPRPPSSNTWRTSDGLAALNLNFLALGTFKLKW